MCAYVCVYLSPSKTKVRQIYTNTTIPGSEKMMMMMIMILI